jgi:hypothetical protein
MSAGDDELQDPESRSPSFSGATGCNGSRKAGILTPPVGFGGRLHRPLKKVVLHGLLAIISGAGLPAPIRRTRCTSISVARPGRGAGTLVALDRDHELLPRRRASLPRRRRSSPASNATVGCTFRHVNGSDAGLGVSVRPGRPSRSPAVAVRPSARDVQTPSSTSSCTTRQISQVSQDVHSLVEAALDKDPQRRPTIPALLGSAVTVIAPTDKGADEWGHLGAARCEESAVPHPIAGAGTARRARHSRLHQHEAALRAHRQ